jgi:predicted short-subunit dehydrogenase-like oxidoreductase (DUF2520 family)
VTKKEKIHEIVLIGAGNVATHLGKALQKAGRNVKQVYSRTSESAFMLAANLNCEYTSDLSQIYPSADLYLFAVSDHALPHLLNDFPYKGSFAAHTSGSHSMQLIREAGLQSGVFYPLQTFSKSVVPDFSNIPLCIEASDKDNLELLSELASAITRDVRHINSSQREIIHIAAVFASNFTNHMFAVADDLLEKNNIRFDVLFPLLEETLRKAREKRPALVQTGPAVRNDQNIIEKHVIKLSSLPDYQKLYNFITKSIQSQSGK